MVADPARELLSTLESVLDRAGPLAENDRVLALHGEETKR
jgi:hypothetical protein